MKTQALVLASLVLVTCDLLACDAAPDEQSAASADVDRVAQAPVDGELDEVVPRGAPHISLASPEGTPPYVMPQAQETFEQVLQLVQDKYIEGPLPEDILYSGATQGLLDRLVQLPGHPVNTVMSPKELAELEAGTRGSIVGVGIAIEMVGDVLVVREVLPGSPAEDAKLEAGDRILGIDGQRLKGMPLRDAVDKIRGEEGSNVDLFVQRDTEEWTETVQRRSVVFESVKAQMLDDGTGLLQIHSFAKQTAAEVEAHLETLSEQGMTSLILDLRKCPGGLLDTAIKTSELLVPKGKSIVVLEKRGEDDDVRVSERETPWQSLRVVSLVGPHTASGAEIVVEALAAADRTTILGEETLGKGTVESIHELDNGWALKLSISRFHAEGSDRAIGEGVQPDIVIPHGPKDSPRDVQLDAAIEMLSQ